jgi:Pyruvate/2-oxoacid:ferredoxin oxidoreductase delta subunit
MAIKPKVALVIDQFVDGDHTWSDGDQNKRGRLSKGAIERCMQLASEGIEIEGYQVSSTSTGPRTVAKVKTDPNAVVDIPNPTRDENTMTAWIGTEPVGMRTVCNNCRRSLTYCPCPSPRVWVSHETEAVVHFKQV